jgi:ribose 5-phosphate isomerase A
MDDALRLARIGERAAQLVEYGWIVGLGTGSTADAMLDALADRVRQGLDVTGVATSDTTTARARKRDIPLVSIDDVDQIDLCIDGADEIDPDLNLVKGRGGALLYEKLVAQRAKRLVIIASNEKLVPHLGTRLPLPVEVVPFGHAHTMRMVQGLGLTTSLRYGADGAPYLTDGGHYILDCETQGIEDPGGLGTALKAITGVVDHGLFIGMADLALTVDAEGEITEHHAPGSD